MKKFCLLVFITAFIVACGDDNEPDNGKEIKQINWEAAADSSSRALVNSFWNGGGKYFNYHSDGNATFHYWPQAHALDVMIDAYNRTGDIFYKSYFDLWYDGVKAKNGNGFWNEYFDDMEWIGLAMLRTYQATNDAEFKDAALQIWGYIKEGWDTKTGGGLYWRSSDKVTKNACSNGPACILAARLYQEFGDENDKEWAQKIYAWEKETLFNDRNGAVSDHIDVNTGAIQDNWIFTYNQGTFVGSAVELYKILGERAYLNDAVLAADYTIGGLVTNSILKAEGTGDGGLFKGIFIRYFTELIQQDRLDAAVKKRYIQFIQYNAETLWLQGTTKPSVFFGQNWSAKPGSSTGLTEQTSGCMLMEAIALLKEKGMLGN